MFENINPNIAGGIFGINLWEVIKFVSFLKFFLLYIFLSETSFAAMSNSCQKSHQKAQQFQNCELSSRSRSDCKDNKISDSKSLPRPIKRSTFRDPLMGCHSTEEGTCTCSHWKRKYLAKNQREQSQIEGCCQVESSESPIDVDCCCWETAQNVSQCEGPLVMDDGFCEKPCAEKKKSCLQDASRERATRCCENSKKKSKLSAVNRVNGKVVLNFSLNLTPQLNSMLKRIL